MFTFRRPRSGLGALLVGVVLVGGLLAGAVALPARPAGAAATVFRVAGNFVGDASLEIFEYRPGAGSDYLLVLARLPDGISATPYDHYLTGTYSPFTGDFDGDGHDELFLYGPGDHPDHIMAFEGLTGRALTPVTVNGLYFPVVGDFTADGADDILWYAPGAAPDTIWEFNPGSLVYAAAPINITGDYVPLSGAFSDDGTDDVILYGRGSAADHLFDFQPGSTVPNRLGFGPLTGDHHRVFTLDTRADGWTDIFFYNPGAATDPYWNLTPTGPSKSTMTVGGTYTPVAGDFFGDGHDDVFWFGATSSLWDFHSTGSGVTYRVYPFGTS
jgi:hypothetical protein